MANPHCYAASSYLASLLFAADLLSATYYIDANNPQAGDTKSGALSEPWKTFTTANRTLVAGDTVLVKAGTYTTYIAPANSGTSAKPITYMNFGTDSVTISGTTYAVYLDAKSHIVVQGICASGADRFLYVRNHAHHNLIAFCNFDNARLTGGKTATWAGSAITGSSQHNRIHHCRFSNYGYYGADDVSCVMDIGNEEDKADSTRYNLVEESVFFHGGHHVMGVYGKFNVIRNNRFHNEPWSMGTAESDRGAVLYGDRNLSFSGYSENGGRNLFERNRVGHSADPSDNMGASGMAMNSSENIVRFNAYFYNISAGLSMSVTSSYLQSIVRNRVYQNSFFNNGHNPYDPIDHMSSGVGFGIYSGTLVIKDNVLKNNVLYKHTIAFGEYNINTSNRKGLISAQVFEGNWNGDSLGDPLFVNAPPAASAPADSAVPDLRLRAGSPCIDRGSPLTTVSSPGGSGTSFTVADAGYFMDGWGIQGVQGDEIQLQGSALRARITAVNYGSNTVTVDRTLTWTQSQGVSLAYEGAAPDVGAYEYGSGNGATRRAAAAKTGGRGASLATCDIRGRKMDAAKARMRLVSGNNTCQTTNLRPRAAFARSAP